MREYPEEYVEIINQWSRKHPKQTYLSKLLEVFPNAKLDDDGTPKNICPGGLGLTEGVCSEGLGLIKNHEHKRKHCKDC